MFLELIAVIVAGIAGAGVMMLIARVSGGRIPKWFIPVAAGAAMTWHSDQQRIQLVLAHLRRFA